MPEGPEVWILSKAINNFYSNVKTSSIGKHLIVKDINENWSFGLTGKAHITTNNELVKIDSGWIYGDKIKYENYDESIKELGLDWMQASREDLEKEVDKWIKSKQKLAALILDQSKICGIGVAWGSEILFKADLRPDMKAKDQVLNKLVDSMIETGDNIKETYESELDKVLQVSKIYGNDLKLREFINDWYANLYDIREMNIYEKGSKLKVLGRSWWVI
jgi:formamidopyrimidine-DNA glycosylase